jgi:hypothetical protein
VLVRDKLEMLRFGAPLSECAIAVCANACKSERMPDHCVSDCNRNSIPNCARHDHTTLFASPSAPG